MAGFELLDMLSSSTEDLKSLDSGDSDVVPANGTSTQADPNKPPPPPPLRYGALPIKLKSVPENSIVIEEIPGENGVLNYDIYIVGIIDNEPNYIADIVTLLVTIPELTKVKIFIASPGGSLCAGARIANAVATTKAQVTTIAVGICGSAAALIWSYGKTLEVMPGSSMLFHMSSHFAWGQSKYIEIEASNTVQYVKEVAIDPIVARGVLTSEEAESILDRKRDVFIDSFTIIERLKLVASSTSADQETTENA